MKPICLATTLALLVSGCATPDGSPRPAFPRKLQALGTEPFWSVHIDGERIAYSAVDEPEKQGAQVTRSEADGTLRLTATLAGEPFTVEIVPGSCSDGMSDRVYPFSAKVRLGTRDLRGCAREPGSPQAPA